MVCRAIGAGLAYRDAHIVAMPDRCGVSDALSAQARSDEIDPLPLPRADDRVRRGIGCAAARDRRRMPN